MHPLDEPDSLSDVASESASPLPSGRPVLRAASTGETDALAVVKVCPQCNDEYETVDRFCPRDGSPLRPKSASDPLIGAVIADRYLILALLGEGGMGRVYLAEHVKMTRQCAIKVMNPALMHDRESLARFGREASSAAQILHPNVATVFDYGEAEHVVYLVMEYVDGESLSAILARHGTLDPRRAIELARQIADGLAAAHELGIVHRDLKPDNVIVARTRDGREIPKIVDFGIAKALSEVADDALTMSGLVIGTPEYMSPEQLIGDPVDARTDVYALGCILYQMLTGKQPFAADSREQMIRRRLHEPPPHVRTAIPQLPQRLDSLLTHMLARSPADRLAAAAAASNALAPAVMLRGWDPSSMQSGGMPLRTAQLSAPVYDATSATLSGGALNRALQPTTLIARRRVSVTRIAIASVIGAAVLLGGLTVWSRYGQPPLSFGRTAVATAEPMQMSPTSEAAVGVSQRADSTPAATPARTASRPQQSTRQDNAKTHDATTDGASQSNAAGGFEMSGTPAPSDDMTLRAPFTGLPSAIGSGSTQVIAQKYPALPATIQLFLARLYSSYDDVAAHTIFGAATIFGDRAQLPITIELTYRARGTGAPQKSDVRVLAHMIRHGATWTIMEMEAGS